MRLPVTLLALALSGLSAKPSVHAQATPLYTDLSGASPANEYLNVVLAAEDGGTFVAGYGDEGSEGFGRVVTQVARLGPLGAETWSVSVFAPRDGDLRPVALHARGTDSLTAVYLETALGGEDGVFYLQAIDAASGATADIQRTSLGEGRTFESSASAPLPGTKDILVGGAFFSTAVGEGGSFLARLRPDGEAVWFNDELEDFSQQAFFSEIISIAVVGDDVYGVGRDPILVRLDAATGTLDSYIPAPFEGGSSAAESALGVLGDTLYWVEPDFGELRVTRIPTAGATPEAFASVDNGFSDGIFDVYGIRAAGAGVEVYGGAGTAITVATINANGAETDRATRELGNFSLAPIGSNQVGALTTDGTLVLTGAQAEAEGGGDDAALVRYDFRRAFPEAIYSSGAASLEASSRILDILPRPEGGVYALRVSGQEVNLRTLDPDGGLVADVPVASERLLVSYYGAAALPSGDIVVFGRFRTRGITDIFLQRIGPGGAVLAEQIFGDPGGLAPIRRNQVRATDDGNVRIFYAAGNDEDRSVEVVTYDADLKDIAGGSAMFSDGYGSATDVLPIPGSTDLLLYGSTDLSGFDADYVSRVTDEILPVWYTQLPGEFGRSAEVLAAAFTSENEVLLVDDNFELIRLGLDDGRERSRTAIDLPDGELATEDIRADDGALVVLLEDEIFDADAGYFTTEVSVVEIDPATAEAQITAQLPAPGGIAPSIYREYDGRTYLGGVRGFGTGSRGLIVAYDERLSPVVESPNIESRVWPNPVAGGQRFQLAEPLEHYRLYDGLGRLVAGDSGSGYELTAPNAPGLYHVVGTTAGGRAITATVLVVD